MEITAVVWLVFMNDGKLFGSYLAEMRAHNAAANINGVLCALPIVMDYRKGD